MSEPDELESLMALASDWQMQDLERYRKEGRRYKRMSSDELKMEWIAAYQRMLEGNQDEPKHYDLLSELKIRGEDAPREVFRAVTEKLAEAHKLLRPEDPLRKSLAEKLAAFELRNREKTKN